MGDQMDFGFENAPRVKTRGDQIFERFEEFYRKNPAVWALFCKFADRKRARSSYGSARAIFYQIRECKLETTEEGLKLSNDYSPYYARMYAAIHPSAENFFDLKKRISEDKPAYAVDVTWFKTEAAWGEENLMAKLLKLSQETNGDAD